MKPGGRLWAVEYIGPDRFDYPGEHTEFARRFYRSVHPGLKKLWTPELTFPMRDEVITADPTESIHSSDIPQAIHSTFDHVERSTPTVRSPSSCPGGSWPTRFTTPIGQEFVKTVLDIDKMLIDSRQLPHYFAYFIATK